MIQWAPQVIVWWFVWFTVAVVGVEVVVVGVAVVVVVRGLHKLVSQQKDVLLMFAKLCRKGRSAAAAHRFLDMQPKAEEVLELFITADEKSLFYYCR